MKFIGAIYLIWPAVLWIAYGGMAHMGYTGWEMDLWFVANIALTAGEVVLAVIVGVVVSHM